MNPAGGGWLFVTRGRRGMCLSPKPQPCPAAGVCQGWLPCHGGVGNDYTQGYPCGCLGIRGRRREEWLWQSWEASGSHCPSWDGTFAPCMGMPWAPPPSLASDLHVSNLFLVRGLSWRQLWALMSPQIFGGLLQLGLSCSSL